MLLPLTGAVGWIYLASSTLLGAMFVWHTYQLRRSDDAAGAMGVFKFSLYYLALIFIAAAVDVLVLG
jgi:protoheme IX farnesyltransferase